MVTQHYAMLQRNLLYSKRSFRTLPAAA
jgi:hypothetical protein